ncbi:hypothetical protein GCM10007916_15360 [Psychromonas marina]|uniref:MFS transporter n=2 Tax=Psychromonas marina TaxID=88364 RepID=A0ABQ6DZ92_9GAMM|nr:hypothetical protein GCM10007916_15360 [Psychromonas marina]
MPILSRTFYLFSAIHSFLLGLLPIFIPVILWDKGLTINEIATFVALSGVGFLLALVMWDRLRASSNWRVIIALSFILQMLLVGLLIADAQWLLLSVGALINGAAGCFYWSTQRILFQSITSNKNSGNTFGNFQIVVVICLKLGILLGSFLLDGDYSNTLIFISFSASLVGFYSLNKLLSNSRNLLSIIQPPAFSMTDVLAFKDNYRSKSVFMVDGLFLFLESYFWVLTIYMLTKESLSTLGVVIVALSLLLAVIFFVIKQVIDNTNAQRLFFISILGYALAWFLRGELSFQDNPLILYGGMLLIAFLSSLFRLAFNKRFYDIASVERPIYYILCKSYYSQFMIVVFFALIALFVPLTEQPLQQLQQLYYLSIPLVFVYFVYQKKSTALIKTPT